jgi:hypothetical protein
MKVHSYTHVCMCLRAHTCVCACKALKATSLKPGTDMQIKNNI